MLIVGKGPSMQDVDSVNLEAKSGLCTPILNKISETEFWVE